MQTTTRPRLRFRWDLSEPSSVHAFPEAFARFLARNSTDVEAFLAMLRKYVEGTGEEDLSFVTICNIASQFADIEDTSDVNFEDNVYLNTEGAKSAEEVLALLDEDKDMPPLPQLPDYDVEIMVRPGDDVPDIIYRAAVGLKDAGYRLGAAAMLDTLRHMVRTNETMIAMLHLVESYVFVDYEPATPARHTNERTHRR